jgi:hypothetical protein
VEFEPTIPVFERAKTFHCLRPRGHCDGQCTYLYAAEIRTGCFPSASGSVTYHLSQLSRIFVIKQRLGIYNFRCHLHMLLKLECLKLCDPISHISSERSAFFFLWGGTYVTRYCGHLWPIVQPQMIDEGDCGAIGGMKIGRGNRSTRRKPERSA